MADNPQKHPQEDAKDKTRLVKPSGGEELRTERKDRLIGRTVGDTYVIKELIGEGGMSMVYLADHQLLDTTFAIKFISTHYMHDSKALQRFQVEAKAACQLNHASICAVKGFGLLDDERPYMVMDYLQGESLDELIKRKEKLSIEEALEIILRILDGLSYAHRSGVIHRDLKPHNIMLCKDDTGEDSVRIVDFGIAKIIREDQEGPNLTQTGEVFGTPNYMSPEQCQGKPVTPRSDIYSIGCVLYEMLSATPPFVGSSSIDTLMNQVNKAAQPLKGVPKQLSVIVEKCLAKDPENRYKTVDALIEDINAFKKGEAIKARPLPKRRSTLFWAIPVLVALVASVGWKGFNDHWNSERNQAIRLYQQNKKTDSLTLIKKAIEKEKYGNANPALMRALYSDLAAIAYGSNNFLEALQAYKESASYAKKTGNIKEYEANLENICNLQSTKLKDHDEQLKHAKLWCESIEARLGRDYPELMPALIAQGMALYSLNRVNEANECYKNVLDLYSKYPGEQLTSVANAHWFLGLNLKAAGNDKLARSHLKKALEFSKRAWPGGNQAKRIGEDLESLSEKGVGRSNLHSR